MVSKMLFSIILSIEAAHASEIGADAICVVAPVYFKPQSVGKLQTLKSKTHTSLHTLI